MPQDKFNSKNSSQNIYEHSVYDSWLRHSSERGVLEQVFTDRFSEWCIANPLHILEFGCGTGAAAARIFGILQKNNIDYTYCGIDPYINQLNKFQARGIHGNITLIPSTTEKYVPKKVIDLSLVVHSLYHVQDLKESLRKICGSGRRTILVHHGIRGIHEIHQQFSSYVNRTAYTISTYETIADTLNQLAIPYRLDVYDTFVDITPCKQLTPDGIDLIKFFLEQSVVSQKILEEVSEFLKTMPDKMLHTVGYFFI